MPVEFDRGLPESLTQGPLIGKLLVDGLGVAVVLINTNLSRPFVYLERDNNRWCCKFIRLILHDAAVYY